MSNTITFIDSIGRTILGEQVSSTDSQVTVKNPAMINVSQTQNGQLQVQLIPLFFAEFVDPSVRADGTEWKFNLGNITVGNVVIDARLVEQYTRVFNPAPPQPEAGAAPTVKLFDEA